MNFKEIFQTGQCLLMEGALGERLKREFGLDISGEVAMASLIYNDKGRHALRTLWLQYISVAQEFGLPFIATTPTRRANYVRVSKWGGPTSVVEENVVFLRSVMSEVNHLSYVGGLMGCYGDAYTGEGNLDEDSAYKLHSWQANEFMQANVDFLYAGIMPTLTETIGMARAMSDTSLPYIISFTIQNNGCLIDGTTINDAIITIDSKCKNKPLCYMTNCVHPTFVKMALGQQFNQTETVNIRFKGIQANTAAMSYKDMDGSRNLIATSNPVDLAKDMEALQKKFGLQIFGGCCGTNETFMREIAKRITT